MYVGIVLSNFTWLIRTKTQFPWSKVIGVWCTIVHLFDNNASIPFSKWLFLYFWLFCIPINFVTLVYLKSPSSYKRSFFYISYYSSENLQSHCRSWQKQICKWCNPASNFANISSFITLTVCIVSSILLRRFCKWL